MTAIREFKESPMDQGIDERVAYELTTTPWGGSPSSEAVVIKLDGVDKSDDLLEGSASVTDDVITTPIVKSLAVGKTYLLEIKWVYQSNTFEAFGWITAS